MNRRGFEVTTVIGDNTYDFFVQPNWDRYTNSPYYLIDMSGVNIGELVCLENESWIWVKDGLNKYAAEIIGSAIYKFLNSSKHRTTAPDEDFNSVL